MTKFAFIDAHRAEFSVVDPCRVGGVSTSGFYDWQARRASGPNDAERLEADLVAEIRVIHARSRGAYGCPRVVGKLHKHGRDIEAIVVDRDIHRGCIVAVGEIQIRFSFGETSQRRFVSVTRSPHQCGEATGGMVRVLAFGQ